MIKMYKYYAFTRGHSHTKSTWVPLPPRHSWVLLGCRSGAPPHLPPRESPRDLARLRLLARGRPPPQAHPREHAQIWLDSKAHVSRDVMPPADGCTDRAPDTTVDCVLRADAHKAPPPTWTCLEAARFAANETRRRREFVGGGGVERTTNNGRWACTCNRPAPSFCSVERGLAGVLGQRARGTPPTPAGRICVGEGDCNSPSRPSRRVEGRRRPRSARPLSSPTDRARSSAL